MKLRIIAFEPEHLGRMQPRAFEARQIGLVADPQALAALYAQRGPAFTGMAGQEIMACGGLVMLWRGVAEVWMVSTALVAARPLAFHRAVKRGLARLRQDMGLWRVQAAVQKEHEVSRAWLARLGFREEGEMPGYGPDGEDYVRMAWTKGKS